MNIQLLYKCETDDVEGKHGRGVHEPLHQLCEEALKSPALLLCHVGQAIQVGDQRAYFWEFSHC